MREKKDLNNFVNSSGYPLQIALEHLVNSITSSHGWAVRYKEHSWKNKDTGNSGFIDLVLIDRFGTTAMIIECKRVQDSDWIFLSSSKNPNNKKHTRVWITSLKNSNSDSYLWSDISVDPITPESEFCVIPGENRRSKPMLERITSEIIEATEALAYEDIHLNSKSQFYMIYLNLIVTTAKLWLCNFDPKDISIDTGKIGNNYTEFSPVSFLRFRKELSTKPVDQLNLSEMDNSNLIRAKENTVFIVNSSKFIEFLKIFKIDDHSLKIN